MIVFRWHASGYNLDCMKKIWSIILIILLLDACTNNPAAQEIILTPYAPTISVKITSEPISTEAPAGTKMPAPTPTPLIHTVALGDTFSSIALRYGLDLGAVQAANPDVKPNLLIVGMELVIPMETGKPIGGFALEPLPLQVGDPDCSRTIEGDWWCVVSVYNPLEEPAVDISVRFTSLNESGEAIEEMTIPTALNQLLPGESLPAAVLLNGEGQPIPNVGAVLASALPLDGNGYTFFPTEFISENVENPGSYAIVNASVSVDAPAGEGIWVWVLGTAYDAEGRLVGIRRSMSEVQVADGGSINFIMNIYSMSAPITDVRLSAEAFQRE